MTSVQPTHVLTRTGDRTIAWGTFVGVFDATGQTGGDALVSRCDPR